GRCARRGVVGGRARHAARGVRELDVVVAAPLRAASGVARTTCPETDEAAPGARGRLHDVCPRSPGPAVHGDMPMTTEQYRTRGGVAVRRTIENIPVGDAIEPIVTALDARRGVLLASSYEYPGRYTRWDLG